MSAGRPHLARAARRLGCGALCALCALPAAWSAFGAHYEGRSHDGRTYRLYLDGGAYAGEIDGLQAIGVTVRRERRGTLHPVTASCTYQWDGRDPLRNRLTCSARPQGPWAGVVYVRDPRAAPASAGGPETLRCVRHCDDAVPRTLSLEEADEDNH